jgi:ubiquinone/menaquinone biosynthesis C-methylase UbiE
MSLVSEVFGGMATTYDQMFSNESVWNIAHRVGGQILASRLEQAPVRIADIGCGTAKWSVPYANTASQIVLADISEEMVSTALRNFAGSSAEVSGHVCSVCNLVPLPTAAFDLVLCMGDPLSYCGDDEAGIAELIRIVRPGGHVFVSVDSRLGYLRIFKEKFGYDTEVVARFLETGNVRGWEGLDIHAFTQEELKTKFEKAGAAAVGVWGLPTVSGYFLFDEKFQSQLGHEKVRDEIFAMELAALDWAAPTGTHHLYGLFRKRDTTAQPEA